MERATAIQRAGLQDQHLDQVGKETLHGERALPHLRFLHVLFKHLLKEEIPKTSKATQFPKHTWHS